MKRVIVFDVNETLLDVRALAPQFERAFGDADVLSQWFAQLLQIAFVVSITNAYEDFGACARHALEVIARKRDQVLTQAGRDAILSGIVRLPPHPEVATSLARLKNNGFRLATLTNSAKPVMEAQLENAGLRDFFERRLSVDAVRRFKPHAAPYLMAATELGVPISQIIMVAAHNWDTSGAIRAGCRAAFVSRPGMVLGPLDERPDIVGNDLEEVTQKILTKNEKKGNM